MERLTKRIGDCVCLNHEKYPNAINKAYKKLASYEDTGLTPEQIFAMDEEYTKLAKGLGEYKILEEQGRLIKLPCKVGDTVYLIVGDMGEDGKPKNVVVDTDVIQRISIRKNTKVFTGRYSATYEENLGKTVFLTKAEAEKALEEMGE